MYCPRSVCCIIKLEGYSEKCSTFDKALRSCSSSMLLVTSRLVLELSVTYSKLVYEHCYL